ncbi:hypothetical protein ACNHYB_08715 [Isoptericola jiangsuensis]|uniref:hypothetical protein n=1 Tax=Isoptericola jiangsuensis TaxID=548579 RepID=UPI003AAC4EE7
MDTIVVLQIVVDQFRSRSGWAGIPGNRLLLSKVAHEEPVSYGVPSASRPVAQDAIGRDQNVIHA